MALARGSPMLWGEVALHRSIAGHSSRHPHSSPACPSEGLSITSNKIHPSRVRQELASSRSFGADSLPVWGDRCGVLVRGGAGPSPVSTRASQARAQAATDTLPQQRQASKYERFWTWQGYRIRYQQTGSSGPAIVLIHGFGASSDHWRKNLPVLGESHRVFAIDLLGYGFSDKPNPRGAERNSIYNFGTWSQLVLAFIEEVVGQPAFLVCNSIGGMVGLQAAVDRPESVEAVLMLNPSLRMLNEKKQSWLQRPFVKALQNVLYSTDIGRSFFGSVATPQGVKQVLCQAYHDKTAVTDELVEVILRPGLEPGAVDVFLDFICYSGGPLVEELLEVVQKPVSIVWGAEDPWEPIALGRAFAAYPSVGSFVTLAGVGHCPQDEAPAAVNALIEKFVVGQLPPGSSEVKP